MAAEAQIPDLDRERAIAIDFRDTIIEQEKKIQDMIAGQEEEAKISGQRLIIALGTRWIPGYKEDNRSSCYKNLNGLVRSMRKFCTERGIPFIDKDDGELLNEITTLKSQKEYANAKIIVLAGEDSLKNELSSLQGAKDAFLFGVDKTDLVENSYIHVVEMLKIALESAITGISPQSNPNLPIEQRNGFWVFVPHADRVVDGDLLRRLYEIQSFA